MQVVQVWINDIKGMYYRYEYNAELEAKDKCSVKSIPAICYPDEEGIDRYYELKEMRVD